MIDAGWINVVFSILGAVTTGLVFVVGGAVAWGKLRQQIREHEQHLSRSNGKLSAQGRKDQDLELAIKTIETNCANRAERLKENEQEHVELFTRVKSLETGLAAIPGKIMELMDARFSDWRTTINSDIRNTIYAIDREKERDRRQNIRRDYNPGRRASNGHHEEDE